MFNPLWFTFYISEQANFVWLTSLRETIGNEYITFDIYLDSKERVIFSSEATL